MDFRECDVINGCKDGEKDVSFDNIWHQSTQHPNECDDLKGWKTYNNDGSPRSCACQPSLMTE